MYYRRFGRTNLQMPVISCGGMRYQHGWQDVDPKEIPAPSWANVEACVRRALALGINHIETARGYGTSEMQLGEVLPRLPRAKLIVQTKVAPSADPQQFRETFETSLRYLKLDHVDLLGLHGINNDELLDWCTRPNGCLAVVRQLQREGRVRFVGFSTHGSARLITRAIATGEFDYVNLHWYFVNPLNWPCILEAARRDLGVFIISPNDKGGRLQDRPTKLAQLCAPLSPMQFNDLYCLARPQVHTLSCGVATPGDFDEHIAALEHYPQAATVSEPIANKLQAEMNRVLGPDWCARWQQGVPEFGEIPGEINVLEILRLWTYAQALELVPWARMRYNLLNGNGGHWFPGRMADEQMNEAAVRAALRQSPFAGKIPAILRQAHALLFDAPQKRLSQS